MNFTEIISEVLYKLGYFSIPASLIISIIIAVIGFLPSVFVTAANVIIFGPIYGFFISWVGEGLGALISFYLYRKGFKEGFQNISAKHPYVKKILEVSGKKAAILIFQARILPFIPSGIVTFASSISDVTVWPFLLATLLGKIPSIFFEAVVSYDFMNINTNWLRLLITLLILLLSFLLFKKNKNLE